MVAYRNLYNTLQKFGLWYFIVYDDYIQTGIDRTWDDLAEVNWQWTSVATWMETSNSALQSSARNWRETNLLRVLFSRPCSTAHCWLPSHVSARWRLCVCREAVHSHTGASAAKSIPRHAWGRSSQIQLRCKTLSHFDGFRVRSVYVRERLFWQAE